MSGDPTSIPPALREDLARPQNTDAALEAMKLFISNGDEATFEQAVALYCTSARAREEPIEEVLAVLCRLGNDLEARHRKDEPLAGPIQIRALIFAGILRAFYGNAEVDRAIGASAQRKADASQHTRSGTWPKQPSD